MIILKEKIPGYNNTLTIATKSMKFGKNPGLNFSTDTTPSVPSVDERDTQGDPDDDNDPAGSEGTRRDTPDSRGYHLLTDLPPEDQRNLFQALANKSETERPKEQSPNERTEGTGEVGLRDRRTR